MSLPPHCALRPHFELPIDVAMQGALGQGGLAGTPPGYESVLAGSPDISQIMSSLRLSEPGALGEARSIWRRLPYLASCFTCDVKLMSEVTSHSEVSPCRRPGRCSGHLSSAGLLGSV